MKKLITLAVLAATSTSVLASNQVTNPHYSKYSAEFVEIHFTAPDNRTAYCDVQLREAKYPYTVWATEKADNEPGSPFSDRQWARFHVPYIVRSEAKQMHVVCPTDAGTVTHTTTLPAPPKVTFTVNGTLNANGGYDVSGGVYVEGNASGTYCQVLEQHPLVGRELFKDELEGHGGYYSHYFNVSHTLDSLYHGYAHTRYECHGVGGTTIEMLEFREGLNGTLEFEQSTTAWR